MSATPANQTSFAMLSHRGNVRQGNEDACGARPEVGAYIICDGMGGAAAGEVASRLAVDTFLASLAASTTATGAARLASIAMRDPLLIPRARLETAVRAANHAVFHEAQDSADLRGMGTTLVSLLIEDAPPAADPEQEPQPPTLWLCHVGDSRCYLFRAGELAPLTEDHSLVEEQVRAGLISRQQAGTSPIRNIITRAIGSSPTVEPEFRSHAVQSGDLYLLASDGLTRDLEEEQVAAILAELPTKLRAARRPAGRESILQEACKTLVDAANDSGGGDNVTVLLLYFT